MISIARVLSPTVLSLTGKGFVLYVKFVTLLVCLLKEMYVNAFNFDVTFKF